MQPGLGACQKVIEKHVPGGVALALQDVDNFFGNYLPRSPHGSSAPIKQRRSLSQCSQYWARRHISGSLIATNCFIPGSRRSRTTRLGA